MSTDKTLEGEYFCPTCGKSMQLQEKKDNTSIENNLKGKIQFWYCLNCSIEWQVDILNNILRKNSLIEE